MGDLSNVLGGPWSPAPERRLESPEDQLKEDMRGNGLDPPNSIEFDGKLRRFASGTKGKATKANDKPGWYVIFGDGVPAGMYGCWRSGVVVTWRADIGRQLTAAEEMAHASRMQEARAAHEAERAKTRETAANTVSQIWAGATAASPDHPYLKRKGVGVHGARVTGDGRLVLPLADVDGNLSSLQYVDKDGGKLYHPGGQAAGQFWMIGTMDVPGVLYLAEGFATAATIHEVTGRPCVVCYSASNLVPVTNTARESFGPAQELVIVADHDAPNPQTGKRVGQFYADQAAAKYGARTVLSPDPGDANDFVQAGGDLLALLASPVVETWLIQADKFSEQPAPISWLVKHWVQANALSMIHGPSGSGKTFFALDLACHMAAPLASWLGHKVKPTVVAYLAGEGQHGLRGRIAAWKKHHGVAKLNMWVSRSGCDLDTQVGYLATVEHLRALPEPPGAIFVDTLHRFNSGDENSSQDARKMLLSCQRLIEEFGCAIVLVHHTGIDESAQHRARGSSAWKGALDIEISVKMTSDNGLIEIVQRKSKDTEITADIRMELLKVQLPGWLDDDGEMVGSAVLISSKLTPKPKKESKLEGFRKDFERAWWASGAEAMADVPYLGRLELRDKLIADGTNERTTANHLNPSGYPERMIGTLVRGDVIRPHEDGWIVLDRVMSSAMMLKKNAER